MCARILRTVDAVTAYSHMAYRLLTFSMALNDLEGHLPVYKSFQTQFVEHLYNIFAGFQLSQRGPAATEELLGWRRGVGVRGVR